MLKALVGIEYMGVVSALQFIGSLDALGEGGQLVVHAVKQADRRKTLEVV